jgi:hypothetical protein
MISLVVLLWACAWVATLAISTLLPKEWRNDHLNLGQVAITGFGAPICFLVGVAIWVTPAFSNRVVWRRKE